MSKKTKHKRRQLRKDRIRQKTQDLQQNAVDRFNHNIELMEQARQNILNNLDTFIDNMVVLRQDT